MHLDTYIQTTACINSIRNKTVINSDIFETHHSQFQKQLQIKTHLSSAQNNQVINSKHNSHLQTSTQNTTEIFLQPALNFNVYIFTCRQSADLVSC